MLKYHYMRAVSIDVEFKMQESGIAKITKMQEVGEAICYHMHCFPQVVAMAKRTPSAPNLHFQEMEVIQDESADPPVCGKCEKQIEGVSLVPEDA